jgi:hypothetical protein
VTITFGPRKPAVGITADSTKIKRTDTSNSRKTDTSGRSGRIHLKKINDSAALKPEEKPVVQKDTSTNQSP